MSFETSHLRLTPVCLLVQGVISGPGLVWDIPIKLDSRRLDTARDRLNGSSVMRSPLYLILFLAVHHWYYKTTTPAAKLLPFNLRGPLDSPGPLTPRTLMIQNPSRTILEGIRPPETGLGIYDTRGPSNLSTPSPL
jgi:hypothetical protein